MLSCCLIHIPITSLPLLADNHHVRVAEGLLHLEILLNTHRMGSMSGVK